MNYYPHHIGDFNSATRHLTRVERSLYRDLIELYYDAEQPLPADDFDRLARRVLAHTDDEKDGLRYVLVEFFTLENDVYRHERCDEEIAKYQSQKDSKSKAGKASAQKRQSEKPKPKERVTNKKPTEIKQPINTCSTDEQLTNNQEPITNKENLPLPPPSSGPVWQLPDWIPKPLWQEFAEVRRKRKKPLTDRAKQLAVSKLEALRDGGHDVQAVIEQTILHAWDTFYPIKQDDGGSGSGIADQFGIPL